jgi:predicted permease
LRGLIVAQVMVAFILANVAALFSSSYLKILEENNRLSSEHVLTAALHLNGERYEKEEAQVLFWQQLVERIAPLPGVSAVGLTSKLPLNGGSNTNALVNDEVYDPTVRRISVERSSITPGYFAAMGLTLVKGRNLEPADAEGEITGVVVNRKMVEKAWPDKDPLGELMRGNNPGKPWYQARVVGVVEDVRQWGVEAEVQAEMYAMPKNIWGQQVFLIVRSPQAVAGLAPLIRREVAALDPELALTNVRTMEAVVRDAADGNRAIASLVNFFMAAALGLVAVGLYGTLSYHVLQRTREIGVRLAMGAMQRDILRLVFVQGSRWVGIGVVLGVAGTVALSFVLSSLVYGMDRWAMSPLALATVAVGLAALLACWLPARRAAALDPLVALRAE